MGRKIFSIALVSIFFACMPGILNSCASPGGRSGEVKDHEPLAGGPYVIELGEVIKSDFNTAPYLPEKIGFELKKRLKGRKLLAKPGSKENQLIAEVAVKASYRAMTSYRSCDDCYYELISHVKVLKRDGNEVIVEKAFHTFNMGIGAINGSDFTEITQAKEIVDFLENLAR